ncbi:hypothetical protein PMZ80_004491 [Knufia obscura]|uniref:BZIP domain-containing protein n=1 Tax=Knufia obscura TaxID=1635080 RepID=A0ABR0RS95_9EURO|nr:hypothetical protein PMZ80_004491 [Knufia obscura]
MPQSSPSAEYPPQASSGPREPIAPAAANVSGAGHSDRLESGPQQAPTLPPVASLTGYGAAIPLPATPTETGSPIAVRHLGMHSILNPAAESASSTQAHRVTQSPARSTSVTYGVSQPPLLSPRIRKRKDDASPGRAPRVPSDGRQGRRMLTPKSPALRSMSQTVRGSPSGVGLPRSSLVPAEGRMYYAEPGETVGGTVPPLPNMPPQGTAQSNDPVFSTATAGHGNTAASYPASNPGYVGSPASSSYVAEREHTSPYQTSASDSGPRASVGPQAPAGQESQARAPVRPYGPGQPSYQMQLSTDQGPMILGVEVDVQQASKMADEKRKRNAGASARFRQRRKEKEQAAASTIGELQRQIRELTEDRDFYLGERNVFRDLLARAPGTQMPPRPPSPRVRRAQNPVQYTPHPEPSPSLDYGRHDMAEPSPAQRRRTSDYQPSFATGPMVPTTYPPPYQAPQPSPYALPPPTLPAPMQDPRNQASGPLRSAHPGPPPQLGHQPPPPPPPPPSGMRSQYDPFRRDPNPR